MDTSRLAQTYFDAWNCRDPAAIASAFADQGTYRDPATGQELRGAAIGAYASELFTAFPRSVVRCHRDPASR
jgi:nuclear transport factor 2 (NTF2) superfamily protein